jgi:hypothetical protein
MGTRLDLDDVEKRKILHCLESNRGRPANGMLLYRLRSPVICLEELFSNTNRDMNQGLPEYEADSALELCSIFPLPRCYSRVRCRSYSTSATKGLSTCGLSSNMTTAGSSEDSEIELRDMCRNWLWEC